jgi:hypothetical protein
MTRTSRPPISVAAISSSVRSRSAPAYSRRSRDHVSCFLPWLARSTIGELAPGDEVFAETGATCRVVAVHPVDLAPVTYRLTFDDGTEMNACADHLWLTLDARELEALTKRDPEYRARRRASRPSRSTGRRSELFTAAITGRNQQRPPAALPAPTGTVRSTREIAETCAPPAGARTHAVPVAGALELPDADLPVDPYVLGAWLGDGHSVSAGFSCADEPILDELRAAGITVTATGTATRPYAYRLGDVVRGPRAGGREGNVNTLAAALRELGVLGDKHVPAAYLRASKAQRLALLRGLMDTDGTANKTGQIEFTTSRRELAEGVYELVVSLGWKTRLREGRATLHGEDKGPKWTLKWSASEIVFRLPRKAERQKLAVRRTARFRYIVGCELPGRSSAWTTPRTGSRSPRSGGRSTHGRAGGTMPSPRRGGRGWRSTRRASSSR